MTKFTIRLALLAVAGSAVAIGCGDDPVAAVPTTAADVLGGLDIGDLGGDMTADEVLEQIDPDGDGFLEFSETLAPVDVEVGSDAVFNVAIGNADDVPFTWTVSSTTIEGVDTLGTLEGTNTGATFTLPATADMIGSHEIVIVGDFEGGRLTATGEVTVAPEPCFYPSNVGSGRGLAFPDFAWNAQYHDGTPVILDLYDFYCNDEEWGNYETMLFLITTDWCPNCPAYIQWIDALSDQLEEAGMLIFYLDVQDNQGNTTYTPSSNEHVGNYTPNGSGIRAGDGDNVQPDGVMNSGLIEYFPTSFVIRRSDMSLIADQRDTSYYLPLVEIAQDPNADWSAPPQPGIVPEFPANCEEGDEESFEPNNTSEEAGALVAGETVEGGVCDSQPDYYTIDIEGAWTLNLEFSTGTGDLDVYVWDNDAQAPMQGDDGSAIGAESTTDDETFSHAGPATIMVYGFRGATAPYSLTVTAD